MKKRIIPLKKVSVILATVFMAAVGMILTGILALADSAINSRGNFVLDGEKISVYDSDIDYLQSELDALFQELP